MTSKKITRRDFIRGTAGGAACLALAGWPGLFSSPYLKKSGLAKKVLILGIDGMDPQLLRKLMAEGRMPTFQKLAEGGRFSTLQTTLPPQSPVAWSSFITGSNPGKHGIYDFLARDPETLTPFLSTSRTFPATHNIELGGWQLPLHSGRVELLRKGLPFWSVLEDHDIPVVLSQLPANFPVPQSKSKVLSGMGTPDVLGTYGTSTLYSELNVLGSEKFTGVRVVRLFGKDNVFQSEVSGPVNSFKTDGMPTKVALTIYRDPWEQVAKVVFPDQEVILKLGEWSDWLPLDFGLVPLAASVSGMVRLYLQSVHPYLRLYMSPVDMDPFNPALPISSPGSYAAELANNLGRFYTQGFPEDTKALSSGVFSDVEFFTQAKSVLEERRREFDYQLKNFKEGVLFFYFSSIDQCSHMLWQAMEPGSKYAAEVRDAIPYLYQQMDDFLRKALGAVDDNTTLIVLSDHGFTNFTRELNLSTWLAENGFTALSSIELGRSSDMFKAVDWSRTKAYVLGINSIYLNLKGREKNGIVEPGDAQKVKQEIIDKLLSIRDPVNGAQVVLHAYDSAKAYWGPEVNIAPDIIVGYQRGYRISDEAVLGKFPEGIVVDRENKWSADHCMDPQVVPGILLSNKQIQAEKPGLWDMAPTIINEFGIAVPKEMDGKPALG